jgi:hypothetical protein
MSLTKQDVRAIKNADSLVFYHNTEYAGERGPWLKAMLDRRNSSTGYDQENWIAIHGTSIRDYEGGMGSLDYRPNDWPTKGREASELYGVVILSSIKVRMEVHTWTKILREGDDLAVEFIIGNNNDSLRKAGLSHDEAWLTVYRLNAAGRNVAIGKYFLDDLTTDVWSPIRMVRPITAARV